MKKKQKKPLQDIDWKMWETIVVELFDSLTFRATKLLKNNKEAEDIVSNTILKVAETRTFKSKQEAQAYLWIAVQNACHDELRKKKQKLNVAADLAINFPTEEERMLAEVDEAISLYDYVDGLLNQLEGDEYELMYKLIKERKSRHQVADEMNYTPDTVKTKKSNIIKKLAASNKLPEKLLSLLLLTVSYLDK